MTVFVLLWRVAGFLVEETVQTLATTRAVPALAAHDHAHPPLAACLLRPVPIHVASLHSGVVPLSSRVALGRAAQPRTGARRENPDVCSACAASQIAGHELPRNTRPPRQHLVCFLFRQRMVHWVLVRQCCSHPDYPGLQTAALGTETAAETHTIVAHADAVAGVVVAADLRRAVAGSPAHVAHWLFAQVSWRIAAPASRQAARKTPARGKSHAHVWFW
mmetsp:Transcript_21004/g.66940  ORF Transcript_21004/g.66940 Transcript_21004/m.66940 type:complete len:219 (+) Transcript_21004:244-900(+)